jgi:RNA polymerase sigma-70 factor (ECF subfamily)
MARGILVMDAREALDGPADAELVAAARGGDQEAFAALVLRYQPLADAYVRHLLDNASVVEDMVQEGFLRAYRALGTLEEPERFGAWLKSILWRECRDWVRKQRVARAVMDEIPAAVEPLGDAAPEDGDGDPWLARLEAAVASMSDANRSAMALFYVLDEPQERIARFLEVPVGTVKRRIFDGRQAIIASVSGEPLDMPERRRFVAALKALLSPHLPKDTP